MKRILCLWLPRWPLQRLCLVRPELKHRPVVLYGPARRGGWQVVHGSRAALARGIAAGMPLAEAQALLGTNALPGTAASLVPHFEPHDPRADREFLESLARWCQRYSPLVGLGEAQQPETLLMEITGCAPLFGGEPALAAQVVRDFHQAGFFAHVAIADTIGAAWALVRFTHLKWPAVVLQDDQTGERLDALPLAALRLPLDAVQTLHELGIDTIGRLRSLPRSCLPSRLGRSVLERMDQMAGTLPELIVPVRPAEPVEADWSFEFPTADRLTLETVLRSLLEQIVGQLAPREQGVQRLACRLFCVTGEPVCLTLGTLRPRTGVPELLELVRLLLEQTTLSSEVLRIHIEATGTGRVESEQVELFDGRRQQARERQLARLVDRLSSRLGRDSVLRPRSITDPQPEYAGRFEAALATPPAQGEVSRRPAPRRDQPGNSFRPLLLKRRPQAIAVVSVVPDGPPIRFGCDQEEHVVLASWGPERIETGWWRGPQVCRDYYRVETTLGRRFWLFRQQPQGGWFLHGVFE